MKKKRKWLIPVIILVILAAFLIISVFIVSSKAHHIKISLSDTDSLYVVKEGNEISLTSDEKSQLIDMLEDITVVPWRYPQSTGWTYGIIYTDTDNNTNDIIVLGNRVNINNKTYRVSGKSSKNIIEYLDSIYDRTLVRISIDNAESITITNKLNHKTAVFTRDKLRELTEALAYKPAYPVTLYTDKDSNVRYNLSVQYKDGTSEEFSIVQCYAILYKDQYLNVDSYALELIDAEVGH